MKRQILSTAISALGISGALLTLRKLTRTPWLTVLTYHRVGPGPAVHDVDAGVVTTTAKTFDRQLDFLKRRFDVVNVEEVAEAAAGGAPLPPSPLAITFDDGYKDNFDVALPLLRKHNLTATFFIATQYVDERRLFWWDRIAYMLKSSSLPKVELAYPYPKALVLRGEAQRAASIRAAIHIVKEQYDLDLPLFLEHLSDCAGVPYDREREVTLARDHVMTWPEVRALRAAGMSVQSHTHTHRLLHTLRPDALDEELLRSRRILESVLGRRVTAIAYPVGKEPTSPRVIREAVRKAGYTIAFSNRPGINPMPEYDLLDAKRISIDTSIDRRAFEALMAVPALAQ
jgi:peptidoglycan/xylan/chitin deacetylase (PgdA/CDA1 family)